MPAQNFSRTQPVIWFYYDPINTSIPQQNTTNVTVRSKNQTGSFPAKKPKPLPVTTNYSTYDYRSSAGPRYDTIVIAKSGLPSGSRKYVGTPTAVLAYVNDDDNMSKYNEAITKLNSAIKNGNWESGVFFAELGRTMTLWSEAAEAVGGFLSSIRKGKKGHLSASWRGIRKSAQSISELWLLYRYGLMPLVYDVRDATELLANKISVYDSRCSVKSPKTNDTSVTYEKLSPGIRETIKQTKIWFKAWFSPPASYSALMARFASQFGLTNASSVLWELLTLSFVVDWLIDVGGYLEALSQPQGFTIYTVERNIFTKVRQTINPNGTIVYPTQGTVIQSGQNLTIEVVKYNRSSIGYPLPRIPVFDPQITAKRMFDAMALLTGNYDRVKRYLR